MQRWLVRAPFLPSAGRQLALGLGLIGIGKPWGHVNDQVPQEEQVHDLLATAVDVGFRYFDTAPSYGVSEDRFGRFLQHCSPTVRASLVIATKFGEHWDASLAQPFVDHSYDALARSLDGSLRRLGRIDFLQLHKTTPTALRSKDVERAFTYANSLGIENLGASVSDEGSAAIALAMGNFAVLQFPLNPVSLQFQRVAQQASDEGLLVVTNRPFGMGSLLYGEERTSPATAFTFLGAQSFTGVVLTGTKSVSHLRENRDAFETALQDRSK